MPSSNSSQQLRLGGFSPAFRPSGRHRPGLVPVASHSSQSQSIYESQSQAFGGPVGSQYRAYTQSQADAQSFEESEERGEGSQPKRKSRATPRPKENRPLSALARGAGGKGIEDLIASPKGSPSKRILGPSLRIMILEDKLSSEEVEELQNLVRTLGAVVARADLANLVLSEVKAPARVKRAIGADLQEREVPVVHKDWLLACKVQRIQLPFDDFRVWPKKATSRSVSPANATNADSLESKPARKRKKTADPEPDLAGATATSETQESRTESESDSVDMASTPSRGRGIPCRTASAGETSEAASNSPNAVSTPENSKKGSPAEKALGKRKELESAGGQAGDDQTTTGAEWDEAVPEWTNHPYACFRPTPLKSVHNQRLVDELEVIRTSRNLTSTASIQDQHNSAAYARAISSIKAYPHDLAQNVRAAKDLKGVGAKIYKLVQQFYELGYIAEAQSIKEDKSFAIMRSFMDFYQVGPTRARTAYQAGARTLEDLCAGGGSYTEKIGREECLRVLPDLVQRMNRSEVERIAETISKEFEEVLPRVEYTIAGSYRRGKPTSSDVDLIITDTSDDGKEMLSNPNTQLSMLNHVLDNLKRKAYLTHIVGAPSRDVKIGDIKAPKIQIAEIVVLPTSSTGERPIHRRVDVMLTNPQVYGATIVGWTGSTMFERDIRRQAKDLGFKFHSHGLVRVENEKVALSTPTEQDVFDLLKLPFMPPHLRNCDA
ncbi:hypothetical protein IE81DRAFT_347449 [Ceraceosorus guamensis]|uniref:DNA polymerase lambda n=1 Tax=Ceraceosorus guamensis TaxID=1522189 RepID=A0A316VYW7_9BASI|nr:hypothetical protein IE81DRAFT_347449 [Ceraceosorus guamensis]PWN42524.1 hypothetical protein IE81DRAFT_347449 [Ceraceosorus guamensis]